MADLSQLEAALINADKAGDTDAAKTLAAEITRLRAAPKPPAAKTSVADGMPFYEKAWVGLGSTLPNMYSGLKQLSQSRYVLDKDKKFQRYIPDTEETRNLQTEIDETRKLEEPLGGWGTAGKMAGAIGVAGPLLAIPGANTAVGSAVTGGLLGASQPTATGEDRNTNIRLGMGGGAAGYGVGAGLGKLVNWAGSRAATIEGNVAAKAAEKAASETASARSAAGNAAQNAYRQLEHLRELGAMRALTPEEAQIAALLEKELSGKAVEKLRPAVAEKEATAEAYKAAMATEAKRAEELAADKLSGAEVKRQVAARWKRYGPAVIGGMIGHSILPGIGTGAGITAGLYLRPAIRSMLNLSRDPAVQYGITSRIARLGLLDDPSLPQGLGLLSSSSLLPYATQ